MASTYLQPIVFFGFCWIGLSVFAQTTPPPAPSVALIPGPALDYGPPIKLKITYDYLTRWNSYGAQKARFYLPIPPETPTQHILSFTSNLKGETITDAFHPPHRILSALLVHAPFNDRDLHWRVQIVGIFHRRHLVEKPVDPHFIAVSDLSGADFLDTTPTLNWKSPPFQRWLKDEGLLRHDPETAQAFGQRLFTYLKTHGRYHYPPREPWNASETCQDLRTDCGGFSLTFTAACRANHIPARLMVGQWFKSPGLTQSSFALAGRQAHAICEFFDPHIGWIPVDLASTLMNIPSPYGDNYFGQDPGFFFAWHHDSDFYFSVPDHEPQHVQWIQNPSLWFSDNATSASENSSRHWSVEAVE